MKTFDAEIRTYEVAGGGMTLTLRTSEEVSQYVHMGLDHRKCKVRLQFLELTDTIYCESGKPARWEDGTADLVQDRLRAGLEALGRLPPKDNPCPSELAEQLVNIYAPTDNDLSDKIRSIIQAGAAKPPGGKPNIGLTTKCPSCHTDLRPDELSCWKCGCDKVKQFGVGETQLIDGATRAVEEQINEKLFPSWPSSPSVSGRLSTGKLDRWKEVPTFTPIQQSPADEAMAATLDNMHAEILKSFGIPAKIAGIKPRDTMKSADLSVRFDCPACHTTLREPEASCWKCGWQKADR